MRELQRIAKRENAGLSKEEIKKKAVAQSVRNRSGYTVTAKARAHWVEKIARLDAEPKVPFEELREIARLDAIENPPEGRFIRNHCIADLVAKRDQASVHRRAFLAAHPDPRERLQFVINKIKADRARLAAEKAARRVQ